MATSLYFTSLTPLNSTTRPGICVAHSIPRNGFGFDLSNHNPKPLKFQSLQVKAADDKQRTKPKSIVCADCDGNGAVQCSQCKGTGVNSVDHFNGRFKAGGLCWLCRGKKEVLCGNCNGAGFVGGFLSTFDD